MAVIIGAGTTVSFMGLTTLCVTSVSWAYNPNVQRVYCLGSWTPNENRTIRRPTHTMNVTLYVSGNTPTYDTYPSTSCVTEGNVDASINAAGCGDFLADLNYSDWVVVSYGYNKDDPQNPAQETWGLQRWDDTPAGAVLPTYILRNTTEGSVSDEIESDSGILFEGVTDTGRQGSVSAGALGDADNTVTGVVVQVGGSISTYGKKGSGSVSIPYTPLWI